MMSFQSLPPSCSLTLERMIIVSPLWLTMPTITSPSLSTIPSSESSVMLYTMQPLPSLADFAVTLTSRLPLQVSAEIATLQSTEASIWPVITSEIVTTDCASTTPSGTVDSAHTPVLAPKKDRMAEASASVPASIWLYFWYPH